MISRNNKAFANSSLLIISTAILTSAVFTKLFYLFPALHTFPQPTGVYAVGTTAYNWTDENRNELYSNSADDKRELQVHFWYPTTPQATPPIGKVTPPKWYPYLSNQQKELVKETYKNLRVPDVAWPYLLNMKNTVIPNALCSAAKSYYPVIIFCHGSGSLPDLYSIYCTELASRGYIVVGINHTYISAGTVLPNGRMVVRKNSEGPLKNTIDIMVADVRFILDKLEEMQNSGVPFFKKLDLHNIGILGHSLGGDAAVEACRIDDRCKVGIDLDGWSIGTHSLQRFNKPFLFLLGQHGLLSTPMPTNKELHDMGVASQSEWRESGMKGLQEIDQLCHNMMGYCSNVIVDNLSHGEFGDMILLKKPLDKCIYPSWARLQSPDPYASIKKMNQEILAFFNTHLKKTD